MSVLLDGLRGMGCDVDSAMGRFLDNEAFYEKCFQKFVADPSFETLGASLVAKDPISSFEAAHTLKGVSANMGATPIYEEIIIIVEALRCGHFVDNLESHYEKIIEIRDKMKTLVQ